MELLLILSALLNAATGAFTGTRAPDAVPSHEAAAEAVAIAEAATVLIASSQAKSTAVPENAPPVVNHWVAAEAPAVQAPLETDSLIE
jgi:hypothetical protein